MFISNGLQFSFFAASLSGFGIRVTVASQNDFGSLPSSAIFWKGEQDRCQLFSKFLVELSCEAIWTWAFVCLKISDYSFNFCAFDGSVKIFHFFLVHFWKVLLFYEFVHFFQVVHFIGIQLLIVISYDPLYFCVFCCDLSIFIFNLLILFFSLCFLMSLACQFYLTSQTTSFRFVDFCSGLFCFFCIIFYALIFKIYFLTLTQGFLFLPVLDALSVELGYLFDFFLEVCLYCYELSPQACFYRVPQVLGCCVFIFIRFYAKAFQTSKS